MDIETRIKTCEDYIQAIISKMNNDKFYQDADNEAVNKRVSNISPYTKTKTVYIGDTEVTFLNIPQGNLTVYFDKPYTVERLSDRIIISFDEADEVTEITISII